MPTTPAAAPPPVRYRYYLKSIVTVRTSYGAVELPANTEVALAKSSNGQVTAKARGLEFPVTGAQITAVPDRDSR